MTPSTKSHIFSGMIKKIALFLAIPLICAYENTAGAADMVQIQSLYFGQFAYVDNSVPRTIVIAPDDTVTYDDDIIEGNIPARRGEYQLTDFPPNMMIHTGVTVPTPPTDGGVTLTNSSGITLPASESFTLSNFTTNEPITDGNGDATLYIGATLTTSGNGQNYDTGSYTGTYDITFYF